MSVKNYIPIKKVIKKSFSPEISAAYIKGVDLIYSDVKNIYEEALTLLLNGNTESSIRCIVMGLDVDREYKPLLHLCKTMLYSLSEHLVENNIEIYKHKYPDLRKAYNVLPDNISELEIKLEKLERKLKKEEEALESIKPKFLSVKNLFIVYLLKKKKYINKIESVNRNLEKAKSQIESKEEDLEVISQVWKIDEYAHVLKLMIEVCVFPDRFRWVN